MKSITALILFTCFFRVVTAQSKMLVPQIFQEGVISKGDYESHPDFTPTGDTLYFIKCSVDIKLAAICVSYLKDGGWTTPQIASFSGQYVDSDPFVTKDGKTLFYISNRPLKEGGPINNNFDIWEVFLTDKGWSAPVHLDAPVNSDTDEYYPTVADNGTIYFGSLRSGGKGGSDIYRCRYENGKYLPAENLGDSINTAYNEYEAFIAPDESYLIFMATVPDGRANADFYISYNKNGQWSKAKKLPAPLNSDEIEWSPKVTRDKKLFYFSSTRNRWTNIPDKPETIEQYNRRLESAGNGLADIYTVDFSVIMGLK